MANTYKNIVITPNRDTDINVRVYAVQNGKMLKNSLWNFNRISVFKKSQK